MNLIEKARLTPEERAAVMRRPYVEYDHYLGEITIASAATAKALWAVADWLLQLEDRRLARKLKEMLDKAHMKRPKPWM